MGTVLFCHKMGGRDGSVAIYMGRRDSSVAIYMGRRDGSVATYMDVLQCLFRRLTKEGN